MQRNGIEALVRSANEGPQPRSSTPSTQIVERCDASKTKVVIALLLQAPATRERFGARCSTHETRLPHGRTGDGERAAKRTPFRLGVYFVHGKGGVGRQNKYGSGSAWEYWDKGAFMNYVTVTESYGGCGVVTDFSAVDGRPLQGEREGHRRAGGKGPGAEAAEGEGGEEGQADGGDRTRLEGGEADPQAAYERVGLEEAQCSEAATKQTPVDEPTIRNREAGARAVRGGRWPADRPSADGPGDRQGLSRLLPQAGAHGARVVRAKGVEP